MKTIAKPDLKSATALTGLEMNGIHFDKKHTLLTPEVLEKNIQQTTAATRADKALDVGKGDTDTSQTA